MSDNTTDPNPSKNPNDYLPSHAGNGGAVTILIYLAIAILAIKLYKNFF